MTPNSKFEPQMSTFSKYDTLMTQNLEIDLNWPSKFDPAKNFILKNIRGLTDHFELSFSIKESLCDLSNPIR